MFLVRFSKKEKRGIYIAIIFISLAFLDRLVVSPINGKIQQINRDIKLSEKQLGQYLRYLLQKERVSKEYQKYLQFVEKIGSDEEEVAKIIGEIEELARRTKIYLVDIKPQSPKEIDFYKEYTVEIEIEGRLEPIVNFLYQINNSLQLLRAEKLRITLKEKEADVIKSSMLITKILIPL